MLQIGLQTYELVNGKDEMTIRCTRNLNIKRKEILQRNFEKKKK